MDYNSLHRTLISLQKLASWRWWQVSGVLLLLALSAGLAGAGVAEDVRWGLAIGAGFLLFTLLDGALLGALPRLHFSFGPVQPPLLALAALRWLVCIILAPLLLVSLALWPLAVLTALQVMLSALVIYGCVVEPSRLTLTRLEVSHVKLAGMSRPVRILHLTDLHMERPTPRDSRVLELAADLSPDLILLTGDYLNLSYADEDIAIGYARDWLSRLDAPLGVYGVLGTPEVDLRHRSEEVFAGTGVRWLRNEAVRVEVAGQPIFLVGVTCDRDPQADCATLDAALQGLPAEAFTILLYHIPDLMPEAAERGIDLYLSGHTHGGQWRVPFYGAVLTSSVYGKRYEMGHYVERATGLYVSRGLGMEGLAAPRARFLCPPEVVLVTLLLPGMAEQRGEE